jgi:molybdate transport system ATP-binding protein
MWNVILECRVPLGNFFLDVNVSFQSRVTSFFGPSGAGKTSLLDTIAGLREMSSGEIDIGGRILFSSTSGVNLPPQERSIGYVPQEAALFPHMTVRKNLLYGSQRKVSPNQLAGIELHHVAELLEISPLLDRSVANLSGGESQRVALARALLSRPQLLLLDEPLASLDIGLKERIIPYLRRVRDEFAIPMIYVTHDPTEVLALADWVILLREGRVVTHGVPHEVLASPYALADPEEGDIENVFDARVLESAIKGGRSRVRLESGRELLISYTDRPINAALQIRINGDDIILATQRPQGISAANVLSGKIRSMETSNGQSILRVEAGEVFHVRLTVAAVNELDLAKDREVFLIIKARSCLPL